MKMKERNSQLKSTLGAIAPKERIVEAVNLPKEDTVNIQGHAAYSLDDKLRLITLLNTLKVQPQFYRSENEQLTELRDLVEKVGIEDPYFLAQCIVYSRCMGEGMRTVNHLAAALAAPFASGLEWSKRFYGLFNKKEKRGGCIFRLDDMSEIKDAYVALTGRALSNAMKKGFASVLENVDAYQLAKYSKTVIDIANLAHPNSKAAKAGEVLDQLMKGLTVSADTWEVAQSEAGQEVAKAVKEGKITKDEAEKVLAEAKADNWEALLKEGKLGVMAALRNIRNIMKNPRKEIIDAWYELITDAEKVRKALILPIHFDLAYEAVRNDCGGTDYEPQVVAALTKGYENAIPNLVTALPGKTCIMVDCSGSMGMCGVNIDNKRNGRGYYSSARADRTDSCAYKAGLIAATIAKATGADVVKFGGDAVSFSYDKNLNVFVLAKRIGTADQGYTNPAAAFELLSRQKRAYDRIIFISDNEVNGRITSNAYRDYIRRVCSPYIYAVDLAGYGTTPLKNEGKVNYYCGYGSMLFEDIASKEFNASQHIDKIRKVVI